MPQQIAEKPYENQEQKDKTKWLFSSKVKKSKWASIKTTSIVVLLTWICLAAYWTVSKKKSILCSIHPYKKQTA